MAERKRQSWTTPIDSDAGAALVRVPGRENLMLLPSVQRNFNADATVIAIFTLLTLGTFTAGVHVLSWQICLLGLIMALGIPAIAWIENSALIFVFGCGRHAWNCRGVLVVFGERRERSKIA
jgi:hypothetical protein